MADEETKQDEGAPEGEGAPKKSVKLKTIIIVVAVMAVEGLAIIGTMMFSDPGDAQADQLVEDAEALLNKTVEVQVFKDKIEHLASGKSVVYDTEVHVGVRQRDAEGLQTDLDSMKAQVAIDIRTIVRQADPAHFREATLATLTRQIKKALDERFGQSAHDEEPIVRDVYVIKCLPIRTDG